MSARPPVLLLDAGLGNLRSVARALVAAGCDEAGVTISGDPEVVARAERVVFPGQGAFRDAALALDAGGGALRQALHEALARGAPYLGLCLGLQVLFEASEESPGSAGLGVFEGRVRRFASDPQHKVPHMGWNRVAPTSEAMADALGVPLEGAWFYFVHSYYAAPEGAARAFVAAESEHGARFCAAVARDALVAVQFHPEKSQGAGLALVRRWLARRG